ncbi:shikimate dehydrogenase [Kordiimonas sp. SCSIO 12610]|uniref:shikimate dehydrogenase n=1 Tax=Kordiimonas sp. SCSIO 12610 TaxID=2829597 RepID=UPI00210C2805|nr:shikimate dehydrogenase [Kordiimonas sp. SCSIO 12610]UTW55469.1 shikimate dehydrogenase [Kordiimonas sp. SCSIO 12610]
MPVIDTKTSAVIGHPISQSLSPVIHNHWFENSDVDGFYCAIDVDPADLGMFLENAKQSGLKGFNVTIPHKTNIIPFLDRLAPIARQMGAVNTVKIMEDGSTVGFNTDGIGLITHLKKSVPDWPKDKPALVIGAGGAARAAVLGLLNENIPMVMLTNRTREKAETIRDELGRGRITVVEWDDRSAAASAAGLVVNTTSLGMIGQPTLDISLESAASDTVVYDIVFKPLETNLLKTARERRLRTVDGLGMLVYQAAASFKIWFEKEVSYDDALHSKLMEKLS